MQNLEFKSSVLVLCLFVCLFLQNKKYVDPNVKLSVTMRTKLNVHVRISMYYS